MRKHSSLHHLENPQSTTHEENTLIITPSRTHNLQHSKRTHSSLHHREPTIYYTRGEHTHHYTIENPQSTTLEENTLIITSPGIHNVLHSRRTHSSLHHREPTIYHTRGEHTHHYTIENPQSTTLEENTLIITPSRTHNLPQSRRTHSSLHHQESTIYHTRGEHTHHYTIENPQSTTLEENTLIITPSRTHNLPHTIRTHSSLHHREHTIYHTHHYTIENPQSTKLEKNTLIITPSRTHNLLHSRKTHSSLHHREPTIYHTRGEHTHHYTIENPQSTTLEENTHFITPSRTHNLPHSRKTHSSLHHREPTIYHTQGEHSHHYTIENPQSTTLEENTLIITPSRTPNLPHSRRTHSSLHHPEPTIYHTRGEYTHHYTIENPQSTTREENTLIITPSRTHKLRHSRRTHSSLHHREPPIYHTRGEHTHHYTIENPQSTTLEENTLIITPSRTHNLLHSRRTHSSLHNREPTIYYTRGEHTHYYTIENPQSTTLEENTRIITQSGTHNLLHSRKTHSSLHHREPKSTTLKENTLIITPSRNHNLPHSRRTHSSSHHREPTIYYTPGEHTHHYTIENPQSSTLEENTFIITPSRIHNLPHSRRIHSSLHHREPAIYHTIGEHTHHYTIENQQATTLEENTFIITPSRTPNLPHSRRTHSSLHHREPTIYYTRGEHTHHYTIRIHNLPHSRRIHSSLHHREPAIYHTIGEHTHHYTIENQQATTLEENTLIITPSRTHNLLHSRRTHSSLHHREPTMYYTRGEHTHHYIIENPQSTTPEANRLIITPLRTHNLLHSRRTHSSLNHREPQSTTLEENTLIITPSRTHNLPHSRRTHSSLHHREPTIYHTR